VFRRGDVPGRPVVDLDGLVMAAIVDPKGGTLAVMRRNLSDNDASISTFPAGGGNGGTFVVNVREPRGEIGPPYPVSWRGGELLAIPSCECDAGPPASYYTISLSRRRVTRAAWLGSPLLNSVVSASSDGGTFVVTRETRIRGCTPSDFDYCIGPPRRLMLVRAGSASAREIARTSELYYRSPVLSPDGRLIAYASGREQEIEVREVTSGRIYGQIGEALVDFAPLTWVSDDTVLVTGTGGDVTGLADARRVLELFRMEQFEDAGLSVTRTRIALLGPEDLYLGWLE
jgi:hypothetical protein